MCIIGFIGEIISFLHKEGLRDEEIIKDIKRRLIKKGDWITIQSPFLILNLVNAFYTSIISGFSKFCFIELIN